MALGPWNAPPNFLQAMSAGASAGAQLRGQDIAQSEAGDRLQLAYTQLASEEKQRNEAAKARLAAATAAMQFRQEQLSLLDRYRQDTLKQREELAAQPKYHFGPKGEVLMEKGGAVSMLRPGEVPPDTATVREPVDPSNPFGATITRKVPAAEALKMVKPAAPAVPPPRGMINSLLDRFTGRGPAATPASPYAEGALIKNKKDGKLYRVKGGVPVEEPGNSPSSDNSQGE